MRDADRFWFENKENGLFTDDEVCIVLFVSDYHTNHTNHYVSQVAALKKLKLSDIIHAVTDINRGEIQENVFLWESGDPCPQPAQLNATEMDPCMYLKGDD